MYIRAVSWYKFELLVFLNFSDESSTFADEDLNYFSIVFMISSFDYFLIVHRWLDSNTKYSTYEGSINAGILTSHRCIVL